MSIDEQDTHPIPEFIDDLVAYARGELCSQGWQVEAVRSRGNSFRIVFEHPLSTTLGIAVRADPGSTDYRAFLSRRLAQREFEVIAHAPANVIHGALLQSLRQAAQANHWEHEVMAIVARVLRANDLITVEESQWLEYAGVPWRE